MQLHIFNPDHDESLAAHSPYYTPRKAARLLAESLAALPAWWAERGDLVLLPQDGEVPEGLAARDVRFVRPAELTPTLAARLAGIRPWGWDARLRHRLAAMGVPQCLLPDDEGLERTRMLSSRQSAVRLLRAVRPAEGGDLFRSRWCTSREELTDAVEAYGEAVAKAPWSGSGRGVFRLGPHAAAEAWQRAWRVMQAQGAVEVEPSYDRVADFAAEFRATGDGRICYEGLSLFSVTPGGTYTGNVVASQERLLARLLREAERAEKGCAARIGDEIGRAIARLQGCLPALADGYRGPLGVDLMLVRTPEGRVAVHPCVEINVRRTMGWVALQLTRYLPGPEAEGRFLIAQQGDALPAEAERVDLTPAGLPCQAVLLIFPHK